MPKKAIFALLAKAVRKPPLFSGHYLTLDTKGWTDVKELLDGCRRAHKQLSMEDLERIVRENNKQRYSFNDDHTKIRVVDTAAMTGDGHTFYHSENGVWLCKEVAWHYVREILYP